ncbi:hypothetical protein [Rhizobium sp. BK176]|uniref:hypothetical protein n=1 Tax=Rhizobium sp. BK176 TaxID=2587071 RepID=UPI00216A06DB|nr:hypothetical protein [Rhizobium sp. BK176]MCS4089204.1 hypothetical protein [Rhizobium sp. BK176]
MRHFIRFGDVPEGKKSKMWTAPNVYMHGSVGRVLPGLSAYGAKRKGGKWVLVTDEINVGSGIASLSDCFYRAVNAPDSNKIYLLNGVATTWKNMTSQEKETFADLYPGKRYEGYDILGTDGEPLVRDFEIISTVKVTDLICKMIDFPEDWDLDLPSSPDVVS